MTQYLMLAGKGWKELRGRKDVENPSWFRFDHNDYFDDTFAELDNDEFIARDFVRAYFSFNNRPWFRFTPAVLAGRSAGRVSPENVASAVEKLVRLGRIALLDRPPTLLELTQIEYQLKPGDVISQPELSVAPAPPPRKAESPPRTGDVTSGVTDASRTRDAGVTDASRKCSSTKQNRTEDLSLRKEVLGIPFLEPGTGPPTADEFRSLIALYPRRALQLTQLGWEEDAYRDLHARFVGDRNGFMLFRSAFCKFAQEHGVKQTPEKFIWGFQKFLESWTEHMPGAKDPPFRECEITGWAGNQPICHHTGFGFCPLRETYIARAGAQEGDAA